MWEPQSQCLLPDMLVYVPWVDALLGASIESDVKSKNAVEPLSHFTSKPIYIKARSPGSPYRHSEPRDFEERDFHRV